MPRIPALISIALLLFATATATAQERIKVAPKRGIAPPQQQDTQPKPEPKPNSANQQPNPDDNTRFNPFGDPSKFTRFGGWGGIGSQMAQWGMARSMLVMMPAVQEELALSADQKKALTEWTNEMRERGQQMAQDLRAQGEAAMRQLNIAAAFELMGQVSQIFQEVEQGIDRILTKSQRKRLSQIAWQMEGVSALLRPEVAHVVQLNEFQAEKIQTILAQSKMQQMGYWIQQAVTMRSMRDRRQNDDTPNTENSDNDPTTETKSSTAKTTDASKSDTLPAQDPSASPKKSNDQPNSDSDTDKDNDDEAKEAATAKRRADRRKEFRKQFDTMRNGTDEIQNATVREVLKVLGPRQRAAFDKLLGPPFDPNKALSRPPSRRVEADRAEHQPDNPAPDDKDAP